MLFFKLKNLLITQVHSSAVYLVQWPVKQSTGPNNQHFNYPHAVYLVLEGLDGLSKWFVLPYEEFLPVKLIGSTALQNGAMRGFNSSS